MALRKSLYCLSVVLLICLAGCGPKALQPRAALDTPQHHVANGNTLFTAGKLDSALREFARAQELDPKYSPAHVGLGLCYGSQGRFAAGLGSLRTGQRYARTKDEKLGAAVGLIRIYSMGKGRISRDWLNLAKEAFAKAKRTAADRPEPYYYMAFAYKEAHDFGSARALFRKVLDLNNGYVGEADLEYAILQKLERAMLGSESGRRIALAGEITRADTAALLVEELQIKTLFDQRRQKAADIAFKSPDDRFVTSVTIEIPPATDISAHPLKSDIDTVIALGIKGLQPFPDHTFRPGQVLTRAEFAMVMEEILVKISGETQLATRYIGSASPFPDLQSDLPFFNAVMTCTTRGMMSAKDMNSGMFDPMGSVSGTDAVLAIRALKSQL